MNDYITKPVSPGALSNVLKVRGHIPEMEAQFDTLHQAMAKEP
jgi:hypothetical protein